MIRWILELETTAGGDYDLKATADTLAELVETCQRWLDGERWYPEEAITSARAAYPARSGSDGTSAVGIGRVFAEFLESGKFFRKILRCSHDKSYGEKSGAGQKINSLLKGLRCST